VAEDRDGRAVNTRQRLIDPRAVGQGAVVGLLVIAPVSLVDLVLSAVDGFDEGGWVFVLFGLILAGFFLAGFRAARRASAAPYTHGALGALAAFGLWLPLRVVTRALIGERLLGREGDAALDVVVAVVTVALLAMSFGILGGLVAARGGARR
jgi:hypothetical protein